MLGFQRSKKLFHISSMFLADDLNEHEEPKEISCKIDIFKHCFPNLPKSNRCQNYIVTHNHQIHHICAHETGSPKLI